MVIICFDKTGGIAFVFSSRDHNKCNLFTSRKGEWEITFEVRAVAETPRYAKYKCHLFTFLSVS